MPNTPVIPEYITVHLGPPESYAANVTLTFPDYIKNVASSEIYPTWPENALRANIYAQISFALNRVYTEFYRNRGYDFDITNSTAIDQAFVNGRDIFENIGQLVDELFTSYVRRSGNIEPLFTEYCNGTTVTCPGLSQWGTYELASRGYTPYEILTYYYGEGLEIVANTPVAGITPSAPLRALRLGSAGNDVALIQSRLNRISNNYPSIPNIYPINGIFNAETEEAVERFQEIFNLTVDGVVGKATWYRIQYIYYAVKRINELNSEGLTLEDIPRTFQDVLRPGDSGNEVRIIQYFLAYVAQYESAINPIPLTGYYGDETAEAVRAFQRTYGLDIDGIVGEQTYNKLFDVYSGIIQSLPDELFINQARVYPGTPLLAGSEGEYVRYIQEYLNYISQTYTSIPLLVVDGSFGVATENAVIAFQNLFDIPQSGIVGAVTWNGIAGVYDDLRSGIVPQTGQYPGYTVGG